MQTTQKINKTQNAGDHLKKKKILAISAKYLIYFSFVV
jgi:hypothetical protein